MFQKIVFIALLFVVTGCSESENKVLEEKEVGSVISSDDVSTSWNDSVRSKVITDKGVFNIRGVQSFVIGDTALIRTYENGRRYLCVSSDTWCKSTF